MEAQDLNSLARKVSEYNVILSNTKAYRAVWQNELKLRIQNSLQYMIDQTGIPGNVELKHEVENLEAVVLTLGTGKSGMFQKINDDVERHLIKSNGALVYQQLFNGKVMVMIHYPFIERYGQQQPPKTVAIYRPEELKDPYFIRHVETFITDVNKWEDYDDDDDPNKRIGFEFNFGDLSEITEGHDGE